MKILIEEEYYPISTLKAIFDDPKFYVQKGDVGKIISVGYYHSFSKNEIIYMLPKVFMCDKTNTVFNIDKDKLAKSEIKNTFKHKQKYNWIRQISVYFYNSLLEYKHRYDDSKILNSSQTNTLNTNLGSEEYSYLDLLLSFINFYKKNKNYILYKQIETNSTQLKKVNWDKTIRKSIPIFTSNKTPVYVKYSNKKKIVDTEEELLTYFFSILNHFNIEHNLYLTIDKSFKLIKGNSFEKLQENGLRKLRKIKYRYFNDTLKRMYYLCEMYFSKTDLSSKKRKNEEFLSVNNYNLVFEDMIDKLFSDSVNDEKIDGVSLKNLKYNDDGKIIDHIYDYKSLIDTSNIFYIGDSKYYKSNTTTSKVSKYKQFTYAKNVIQYNIDLLNKNLYYKENIRYRDEVTEGYNITPNFFIFGYIKDEKNFDNDLIRKTGEPVSSYHFKNRLFDRDTLFVHQYKINFLFALKAYTSYNTESIKSFRKKTKTKFRNNFIEYFNDNSDFEIYKCNFETEKYGDFINQNFRVLNGKCFITNQGLLLIAKHKDDTEIEYLLTDFELLILEKDEGLANA